MVFLAITATHDLELGHVHVKHVEHVFIRADADKEDYSFQSLGRILVFTSSRNWNIELNHDLFSAPAFEMSMIDRSLAKIRREIAESRYPS